MKNKRIAAALCLMLLFFFIAGYGAQAAEEADTAPIRLPVIMYHQVKPYKAGKDVIMPWEFENDLKYLAENGYTTVTVEDLVNYAYNGGSLPEKPIMLTFDDGYLNTYVYVFPLLEKYRMKIVLSVIGKNSDDFTNIPDKNLDYSHVTWNQLNEMAASGLVEVQNHTYDLHKVAKGRTGCGQKTGERFEDYEKVLTEDIKKLQDKVVQTTGRTPTAFAYPYGKCCDNAERILKNLGFKATLTCNYGVNLITREPECLFRLKRICRSYNQPVGKMIKEGLKTIR